jgi:Zn-dependent peptidase ImmA (M78 family)
MNEYLIPESSEIVKKEATPFQQLVVKRCIDWTEEQISQGKNPRKEIFRPKNFGDDWQKISAVDYFLHRLSVIGLPASSNNISTEVIEETLRQNSERTSSRIAILTDSFAHFNESMEPLGLPAVKFDAHNIYLLDSSRIIEITSDRKNRLAFSLNEDIGEMIICNDDDDIDSDPNQLYDIVIHELGHQVRTRKRLNKFHSNNLEEGIIQQHARTIEQKHNRISKRTTVVHLIEADVVQQLMKCLGVASMLNMNYKEIQKLVNDRYYSLGRLTKEPFIDLVHDLAAYKRIVSDFEIAIENSRAITKNDIEIMKHNIQNQKDYFYRQWQFT